MSGGAQISWFNTAQISGQRSAGRARLLYSADRPIYLRHVADGGLCPGWVGLEDGGLVLL